MMQPTRTWEEYNPVKKKFCRTYVGYRKNPRRGNLFNGVKRRNLPIQIFDGMIKYGPMITEAIEFFDGVKIWLENGRHHRLDGPAIIWETYRPWYKWYINGEEYSFADWSEKNPDPKKLFLAQLKYASDEYVDS